MNVHISLIGRIIEPVLKGFQFYPMDKLYLLHSQNNEEFPFEQTAKEAKRKLAEVGFTSVILEQIKPFDMNSIISSIMRIAEEEKNAAIYVNITGGTNLMAGAACSASFFIGAKAYYILDQKKLPAGSVLKDQVVELPIPKVPSDRNLQRTQNNILMRIGQHGGNTSSRILRRELNMNPQKLSYHIKELETKGLVTTRRGLEKEKIHHGKVVKKIDTRILVVGLTNAGRMIANWTQA